MKKLTFAVCAFATALAVLFASPTTSVGEDKHAPAEAIEFPVEHEGGEAHHHDGDAEHGHEGEAHGAHGDVAGHGDAHGDSHGGGHASHGNSNPLSVDPDLALFTAIIFLLLAIILRKFAWGPIRDAVEAREKRIADQLAEAHRNNEEARRLLAEHETKLATASTEVKDMLDQARKDADTHKASILAEAETAAKAQKDRAVREITAAKNSALEDLAKSSVDQAVGLAGQIMGKKLSKGDHSKLIADAMKQFPSKN